MERNYVMPRTRDAGSNESVHIERQPPCILLFFFFCCPLPRRFDFRLSFPSLLLPRWRNMICHQSDRLSVVVYVPTFDLYSHCVLYLGERREMPRLVCMILLETIAPDRGPDSPSTVFILEHTIRRRWCRLLCQPVTIYILIRL